MASAFGISLTSASRPPTPEPAPSSAPVDAAPAGARVGATGARVGHFGAWIYAGGLCLLAAGGVLGFHAWRGGTMPKQPVALRLAQPAPPIVSSPSPEQRSVALEGAPARVLSSSESSMTERASTSTLSAQTSLIDRARALLAAGDAAKALVVLESYERRYPRGVLRPEGAALRTEALFRLHRLKEARALARAFRETYGPGPLADRVARMAAPTSQVDR